MTAREWMKVGDEHVKTGATNAAIEAYRKAARLYRDQGFGLKALAVTKQILALDPSREDVRAEQLELARQLGLR